MKKSIRTVLVVFLAVLTLTIGTGIIAVQTNKIPSSGYPNLNLAALLNQKQAPTSNSMSTTTPNSLNPQNTMNPDLLNNINQNTTKEGVQARINEDFKTWTLSSTERMMTAASSRDNATVTKMFTQFLSENPKDQKLFKQYDQLLSQEIQANMIQFTKEVATSNYMSLVTTEGTLVKEWNQTITINGTNCIQVTGDYAMDVNGTTMYVLKTSVYDLNGTLISDPWVMEMILPLYYFVYFWWWCCICILYGFECGAIVQYPTADNQAYLFVNSALNVLYYDHEGLEINPYVDVSLSAIAEVAMIALKVNPIGALIDAIIEAALLDYSTQLENDFNVIYQTYLFNLDNDPAFGFMELTTFHLICPAWELVAGFSYMQNFVVAYDGATEQICPDQGVCYILADNNVNIMIAWFIGFWYYIGAGSFIWFDDVPPPSTSASLSGIKGNGDSYISNVRVTLSATSSGPKIWATEYSFDNKTWNLYTGPFTISNAGTTTIYYNSTDEAGNMEQTKSITITINKAPSTSILLSGTGPINGWYTSNVILTFTATSILGLAIDRTEYSTDGTNWIIYNSSNLPTISTTTTLYYRSVDVAGNTEPTNTMTIYVDQNPPATTASLSGIQGLNGWNTSKVAVTLTATDDASGVALTQYGINSTTNWNTYTNPFIITSEGNTTLYYRSIDLVGNVENTNNISVLIDKTPPVTNINLNGTLLSSTQGISGGFTTDVNVTLTARDGISGVSSTENSFDGVNWFNYTGPFAITKMGTTNLYYRSIDNAGNVEDTKTIQVLKVPPWTTASFSGTPGLNGWYISNVRVTLSVTSNGPQIAATEYSFDNTTWYLYTGPFTISNEGTTTLYYYSVDKGGNVETTSNVPIMIDKSTPITTANLSGTPGLNNWYTSDVNVILNATDNAPGASIKTEYSLDGVNWNTYTGSLIITTEGITTLYYQSIDLAGNVESAKNVTIMIDKTPPVTLISLSGTLGRDNWYTSNITVTLTATDSTSGVAMTQYSLNDSEWINYTGPFIISAEGIKDIYFNSTDNAGNVEYPAGIYEVKIDETPPVVTTGLSSTGTQTLSGWYNSDVNFTLTTNDSVSGVTTIQYSFDGTNWYTYNGQLYFIGFWDIGWLKIPLWIYIPPSNISITISTEGTTTIYYRSIDDASNVNSGNITVNIDKTPPVTTASLNATPGLNGWYTSDVDVTLHPTDSESGVAITQYSINGTTNWTNFTGPFTISNEGTTTIYYKSTDNVGNVENASSATVMVDKTPTATNINLSGTLGQNHWYTSDVNVNLTGTTGTSGIAMVEYSFDCINWFNYNGSLTVSTNQTFYFPFLTRTTNQGNTSAKPLSTSTTISNEGVTILYYRSINFAGNIEDVHIEPILVDKAPPVTSIGLNGVQASNGTYTSNVIVTLKATDTAAAASNLLNLNFILNTTKNASATNCTALPIITGYKLDSSSWVNYTGPFNISTNGVHTIAYNSTDYAGNVENTSTRTITIQRAPLVTSVKLNGTQGLNGWYTSNVTVTLNATDNATKVWTTGYKLNSNNWTNYTAPFTISAEGINTLYYNSTDNKGNAEKTNNVTLKIDKTPPVTTISLNGTRGSNGWYTSDVNVTLNATDNISGVWMTGYMLDSNGWFLYNGPFAISTEGVHNLSYASIDNAGEYNISNATIKIDKTPPVTTISLNGIQVNGVYISNVIVTLNATDNSSGVALTQYSFDGTNWKTYNGPFNITVWGTTTVYFNSTDYAGQMDYTKTIAVAMSMTLISLNGTAGLYGWYKSNVTVTLTPNNNASGVKTIKYSLDGANWITYTAPFTISAEGVHTKVGNKFTGFKMQNCSFHNLGRRSPHPILQLNRQRGQRGREHK
ncbi:MAG: hypothetical protein WED07_00610 [Candidatus Freyarchaeum deiterrae]